MVIVADEYMDDGGPSATALIFLMLLLFMDIMVYGFGAAIHNLKTEDLGSEPEDDSDESVKGKSSLPERTRKFLLEVIEKPTKYVNTVQLLVFLCNFVVGRFFISSISKVFLPFANNFSSVAGNVISEILAIVLLLYIFLSIGVLLPKIATRHNPLAFARFFAEPIRIIMVILRPMTFIVEYTVHGLLYLSGVRNFEDETDVTEEEIRSMVSEGQEQGVLEDAEANMISNIFEFSDKEVRDIMTNRNDLIGIEGTQSLDDATTFMLQGNNSRFPVYLNNIDHIIGIVHIRDAMKNLSEEDNVKRQIRQIRGLMRQPMYVPETRKIESLFHSMQSSKTQMAIVIDEYGQTAGLVTMEDILEEIVGNIMDEYDEDEVYIVPGKRMGEFIAQGKTPVEVIEKRFDITFHQNEFETLNGVLISKMDRIPEEDEKFECVIEGYLFKILSVSNHMISDVLIQKQMTDEKAHNDYKEE